MYACGATFDLCIQTTQSRAANTVSVARKAKALHVLRCCPMSFE